MIVLNVLMYGFCGIVFVGGVIELIKQYYEFKKIYEEYDKQK